MRTRNHSDHPANVIPLFTSATAAAISTRRFVLRPRGRALSRPDAQGIEAGIANGLDRGNELAWFWEDAALVLLGSTGIGAIGIAFHFLA